MNMKVSVIGLGYIGLPTAAILATKGYQVLGCDVSSHAVECINCGLIHIIENDLDNLVKSAVQSGQLKAFSEPQPADVFILAVPTPFKYGHEPDLSFVHAATLSIAPILKPGDLIILESTSPVGTTDKISQWLTDARKDLNIPLTDVGAVENSPYGEQIYIAHCPERVLPGQIVRELVENDRIIGGIGQKSGQKAAEFYKTFVTGQVLVTNARTAEMAKLAENAYRDVNIAFANELANICSGELIDVEELIKLANHHPRVNILKPGIGVGGHCLAVDPWFIVDRAKEKAALIKTAREINDARPKRVIEAVKQSVDSIDNPRILCLGLSYKPDIDDLRESPAMEIVESLCELEVGQIFVAEPNISKLPARLTAYRKEVATVGANESAALGPELVSVDDQQSYDVVVLLVQHKEFDEIVMSRFASQSRVILGSAV